METQRLITSQLPNVKHCQLLLTEKEDENYANLITNTAKKSNCILIFLDQNVIRCQFQLKQLIIAATEATSRVYFIYPEDNLANLIEGLESGSKYV